MTMRAMVVTLLVGIIAVACRLPSAPAPTPDAAPATEPPSPTARETGMPPRYDGIMLPQPTPGAGDSPPAAWLISDGVAVLGTPVMLPAEALPVVAPANLAPDQAAVILIDSPIVPLLQATLRPWAAGVPLLPDDPAARPLATTRRSVDQMTAFALEPLDDVQDHVLHVMITYAIEPGGPADDPAVAEAHYLWRINPTP